MKNRICLAVAALLFNLGFVFSQNTGANENIWYKINSKGKFITKIKASGEYAEHEVVLYLINQHWATAEVNYISEFNYNHKSIKLEWGYTGNGASRNLTVRVVPVTAAYANSFTLQDVTDPDFDYALTSIDASLVTPISPNNRLFINEWNGNVGIGTTNPDSKLTVAGKVHAQEVKVTITAGADFVFEDNYQPPSLKELESFIKTNKHLPEIASAKEMESEGLELGEMNIKLLQKIEELTLYTIEQEKDLSYQENEMKFQNERIEKLEKENKKMKILEERLRKIENQLKK